MTASTPLRQRMIEDLQLHGLAAKTQDAYGRVVKQLAAYYHKAPDVISEDELRQYLLYLQNERHVSGQYVHHRPVRPEVLLRADPAADLAHV